MRKLLLALPFLFFLSACASHEPVVVTSSLPCNPPAVLMQKTDKLPMIAGNTLGRTQIFTQWAKDIEGFNILNIKNGELIDWVAQHCQK